MLSAAAIDSPVTGGRTLACVTTPFPGTLLVAHHDPWIGSDDVARRINRTPLVLGILSDPVPLAGGATLALATAGTLRLDAAFERSSSGADKWRSHGRLVGQGPRLVLFSRVEVLIAPWSRDACELRVIPRSRYLHRWGRRRLRRYWQLAHAAADALVPILLSAPSVPPTGAHGSTSAWPSVADHPAMRECVFSGRR